MFDAIRLYITMHRLALSSATIIQALELGKPVLVPDRGLLGYRVRKNNLGDVYTYGDLADLRQKAEELWQSDLTALRLSPNHFGSASLMKPSEDFLPDDFFVLRSDYSGLLLEQVAVVRDEIDVAGASCHAHLCNAFMTVPRWHHARREECE